VKATPQPSVDVTAFRDAAARFASGVTVAAAAHNGVQHVITATAFASLSIEPPLVLLALGAAPLSNLATRFFEILPLELGSLSRNLAVIVLVTGIGLGTLGSYVSVRSYLLK